MIFPDINPIYIHLCYIFKLAMFDDTKGYHWITIVPLVLLVKSNPHLRELFHLN